ncbi:MAG: serine hydrolase [Ruminococcaceae bacterium]|nr:serine hydrolase [Oscillospiraceae bacterium]
MKKTALRLLCLLTVFATLVFSLGASAEEQPTQPKRLEIDDFRDITTANVERILSTGSYKITDVPPETLTLPDNIPTDLTEKLEKILDDAPYSCAMYYIDLETGFEITYNAERWFGGASTIKAPFMMALLDKIERGEISFDDTLTYSYDRTGTVQISKDYELGAKLSIRLLIEYLIYYSDNVAFSLLLNQACKLGEFRSFCRNNYGGDIYKDGINQLNAKVVAKAFEDLYHKSKTGNEIYVWYVELLKQANENKFVRNGLPKDENGECIYEVAHKYGMDINASNDAAIVFCGERPYVLVVLTDYIGYNTQYFINRVSSAVYDIHLHITNSEFGMRNSEF